MTVTAVSSASSVLPPSTGLLVAASSPKVQTESVSASESASVAASESIPVKTPELLKYLDTILVP